ncbi:MAG: isoprenylcysteine carboxylmethyltransferase family protein [Bacteroidota bacterium]
MRKTAKDYWFVGIQLVLFLLFALTPSIPQIHLPKFAAPVGLFISIIGLLGVLLSIFQLSDALTPYPSPKKDASLKTDGLYRFSRHPIYSTILLFCIGWTIYSASFSRLFLTVALYALFYFKSNYEEKRLIEVYGEHYLNYKGKTPRFFL